MAVQAILKNCISIMILKQIKPFQIEVLVFRFLRSILLECRPDIEVRWYKRVYISFSRYRKLRIDDSSMNKGRYQHLCENLCNFLIFV
jgi:hypothetical protein